MRVSLSVAHTRLTKDKLCLQCWLFKRLKRTLLFFLCCFGTLQQGVCILNLEYPPQRNDTLKSVKFKVYLPGFSCKTLLSIKFNIGKLCHVKLCFWTSWPSIVLEAIIVLKHCVIAQFYLLCLLSTNQREITWELIETGRGCKYLLNLSAAELTSLLAS